MVVVAIIGILAAIALPAYQEQIRRGRRADAQTVMLQATQYLQRYYAAQNTFKDATLPDALVRSPSSAASGAQVYDIAVSNITSGDNYRSFKLTASLHGSYTDANCGALYLTDTGAKSAQNGTAADCWR